mgnify:CR=1 FL=1
MKIRHEVCIDNKGNSRKCDEEILIALGHGPGFKLKADTPDDTVHGAVTIAHCDPRTLGEDVLQFRNGAHEVATAGNIGAWFEEQGHKLMKIVGNKAYGNTILDIKITDTDEAPNKLHKTTFKRAAVVLPTAKECCDKINAHLTLKGLDV